MNKTSPYINYTIQSHITWDSDNPNIDIKCVIETSSGSKFTNRFDSVEEFNEFNDGINQIIGDRKYTLFCDDDSNNKSNYNPFRNIPIYCVSILRGYWERSKNYINN